jgi:uncharacterized protein YxjI
MKQKLFSWGEKFTIWDEDQQARWFAEGEVLLWGRKLHVTDANGTERALITKEIASLLSRYDMEVDGRSYTLVKKFTLLVPKFRLENTNWAIEGDVWDHEYEIVDSETGDCVMQMNKEWCTWADTYALSIPDGKNELLALCVALAIDCVNADADD